MVGGVGRSPDGQMHARRVAESVGRLPVRTPGRCVERAARLRRRGLCAVLGCWRRSPNPARSREEYSSLECAA